MTDEQPRVTAVAVKLPPFWPSDPQIWFAQVQAQFSTRGINNQRTIFDYVIASLSPEFATEICDLILTPPEVNPYDILKEQLIKQTAASEQRRLQQLFSAEELGDRKPTQLLRRLKQLAGDTPSADGVFLRELFLQRLPTNVCMVLASTRGDTTIEELAQLADQIIEIAVPEVATVSTVKPDNTVLEHLCEEITGLKQQIQTLQYHPRSCSRRHSMSPAPPSPSTICRYHQQFGDTARKCKPPCNKSENDQASR